jgi:hypothetical protein
MLIFKNYLLFEIVIHMYKINNIIATGCLSTTLGIAVILTAYTSMNCKLKLSHSYANINFNKTCMRDKLIPKHAPIRIPTETAKKKKPNMSPNTTHERKLNVALIQ